MGDDEIKMPRWVTTVLQWGVVLVIVGVAGMSFALCVRGFLYLMGGC